MRVAVVCLAVVLGCSCCRTGADSGSTHLEGVEAGKRAICASLKERYDFPDITFEVRGPLTIAEIERETAEEMGYSPPTDVSAVAFGFEHARWVELKGKCARGDEFYYFTSDERSWRHLSGIRGYVLVRESGIIDTIVSGMN